MAATIPPRAFRNRAHAGKLLAAALRGYAHASDTLVLALPRGGVAVGFAVATELGLPLDIFLVRKLGMPGHEEFAIGAVASGGTRVVQPELLYAAGIGPEALEAMCAREMAEIERRDRQYRGARPFPDVRGQVLIVVDDGLATGASMRAAIAALRARSPARIVVAVPVGAPDTCAALRAEVDQLVCLRQPASFRCVSQAYAQFDQATDDEVQDLLALAWRTQPLSATANAAAAPQQDLTIPSRQGKLHHGYD